MGEKKKKKKRVAYVVVLLLFLAGIGQLRARYVSEIVIDEVGELEEVGVEIKEITGSTDDSTGSATTEAVDWEVELPATACLYDTADSTEFNNAIVVKRLKITNTGQESLKLTAAYNRDSQEGNILVYIAGSDLGPTKDYRQLIRDALLTKGVSTKSEYDTLQTALSALNKTALETWSDGTEKLEPGASRDITLVIWRENTAEIQDAEAATKISIADHLQLRAEQTEKEE